MRLRALLLALALVLGLAVTPTATQPVQALSPYLACTYVPGSSSRTTYSQTFCVTHNRIGNAVFRNRITCQYFSGIAYITYNKYSGWKAADAGLWTLVYCDDHHQKPDRYSPAGPDIVIHSWVEYSGGGITWVNGGF